MTNTTQNTNTNEYNLNNLIGGYECEVGSPRGNYISPDIIRRALKNANLNYVYVTTDGSSNVDAEIIFPPLVINQISVEMFFKPVLDVIASTGAIVRKNCGGHIHIGIMTAVGSAVEFNQKQIAYFKTKINNELSGLNCSISSMKYIAPNNQLSKILPFQIIKDVIIAYSKYQNYISSTLPESRRDHNWAKPINAFSNVDTNSGRQVNMATTISGLTNAGLTKQKAINCSPLVGKKTLEFRQGASTLSGLKLLNWFRFIQHLYTQSFNRCDWSTFVAPESTTTRTIETTTPTQHNNGRSFVARVYDMCRNHNNGQGATIEEIMNVTNAGDQNIRSRISELRRTYGQGAIVTHTQQSNDHVYGDGQIYCRYQILHSFNKTIIENSDDVMPTIQIVNTNYDVLDNMPSDLIDWNLYLIQSRTR